MSPLPQLSEKLNKDVGSGVSELFQKFNCDYCQEDISGLRIRCADCPDFDLCLPCFCCGAQNGQHKNNHNYVFMNNGSFDLFPREEEETTVVRGRRLSTVDSSFNTSRWNAREEMRLLDAVEQYGYGNWKDIAGYIETKRPEQACEEYTKQYIHGIIGRNTWKEELRAFAIDHTQTADRGPLSPSFTGKLQPLNINAQETNLLGYMPFRDDYEDFDWETEQLVSQIANRSVEDEPLDVALKLALCDIYERKLRQQVRRKRVARDYQLGSKFFRENPIITVGRFLDHQVSSPLKIYNQVKAVKRGDGPKHELINAMKAFTQFLTCREFNQLIENICLQRELQVRISELLKYRRNGLTKESELVPFERQRFKRILRARYREKKETPSFCKKKNRLLPISGDFSLKSILHTMPKNSSSRRCSLKSPVKVDDVYSTSGKKKKNKKTLWSRRKEKTGRRLLLQKGCIVTHADETVTHHGASEVKSCRSGSTVDSDNNL